ncbi:MAG: hypothetical protein KDC95_09375 [Planctomycetes bacterium]|nr:hypothetical protein [Planctomycetota bacterium]
MTRSASLKRASIVFVACMVLYTLAMQREPYGDGISYLTWLRDSNFVAHHLFYLPPMWVFARVVELVGLSERSAAFAYSAFCAAAGSGILTYLLARSKRFARGCTCPVRLALLVATTPAMIFYATTVENHANHYLWICVMLFALDRALDPDQPARPLRWFLAGIALLLAFSSHVTSGLLWPALALVVHASHGSLLRRPTVRDVWVQALFFGPSIAFLFGQSQILVWLSGDENWGKNASGSFAWSLLAWRSLETWFDYFVHELVLPFWGFVWGLLALGIRRFKGQRLEALLAVCAVLPYFLFFGHWNVREFGAYYLPLLPVLVIGIGRLMPALRREESIALIVLIVAQGIQGTIHSVNWVTDQVNPPWTWADDAVAVAGPQGTILCWDGMRALHVEYDHEGCKAIPLHNWTLTLSGPSSLDPDLWAKVGDHQLIDILRETHARGGRLVVGRDLVERIDHDPALVRVRPFVSKLRALGLESADRGIFRGWVVKKDG